ncbi:MAG: hypothetical protein J6Y13_01745 [Treponema sp.]|nr:hypothetical protein [Treponema sp.]
MRRMSLSRCLLRFRLSLHVLALTLMVLTLQPLHSAVGDDLHGRMDQTFLDDLVRKNWDTADGLPGMTITSLMQDRKGYVWIGTYDGLVRFDGVEFTTYSRSTDENYDFASARSLIQDSKGNIWVGHNDEGLTRISPDGEIRKYMTEGAGLPNNKVNALCEDREGNIWVGTSSGLCWINPEGKVGRPDGIEELGIQNIMVQDFFCDSRGRVWVTTGSEGDCFVYDGGRLSRFEGIQTVPGFAITVISEDADGALWFGGAPSRVIRVKDGVETAYSTTPDGIKSLTVSSIMHDSAGNCWIGTDAGIMILRDDSYAYYSAQNGLPDNGIVFVMEDREQNIWIALNRGGLQKLSRGKFRPVRLPASVNSICEDRGRGVTWIACDDGIRCYKDGQFVENAVTDYCAGIRVRHAGLTRDGELLISSYSAVPLVRVSPDGSIRGWTVKDGIATTKGRVAIKIRNGDYYEGTPQGLSIIHHEDGHISTLTREDGFSNHYIMWLYEDSAGRVWAGTNGGGVFVLEDEKIVRHYTSEMGLAGNVIFKILEYDGSIWIGTGTGLSKYIEERDTFVCFNSRTGLGTDSVFQMICDDTGLVWMTSNKGVFSVPYAEMQEVVAGTRKKVSARYYGASDGLITSGVTSTSLSEKDSAGRVWFTLTDGFAIYDPAKSGGSKQAPKIEIQNYAIDNVASDWHGETIVLAPSAKRLSIKYTGMSFISSDSMRFRYRLAGFDEDYSDWTAERSVSYTNLKPGSYQFTVISQNSDGIQGEPSFPLTVVKQPYLWQRPWFWPLLMLVALELVVWKIISMLRYQKVLEQKVDERTHELKLANEKAEGLLLNILPAEVAAELTEHPDRTIAKKFPNVTVLFTDIVGFTKMSGVMSAEDVVTMLNRLTSMFDERARREGIEKIKTIGDAYMAATGLCESGDSGGAEKMIRFAQGLLEDVRNFNDTWEADLQIRVGVNTGNLVAGIIGKSKFIYDLWGDTVNVASRMESTGMPMRIHVSEATWAQTKETFSYGEAVEVTVKGKGEMRSYFL